MEFQAARTLANLASFTVMPVCFRRVLCVYMKKIYTAKPKRSLVTQPRSFRRLFKRMFTYILKRQNRVHRDQFQSEVSQQLKNLENKIEAATRAMARQVKRKDNA
jgi:hypothetical protein